MPEALYQTSFVLTVAESKRLIAQGIKRHPAVLRAFGSGLIAVAKGTTNGYIVEELTGKGIYKPHYCTGTTQPHGVSTDVEIANKLPDLVLRNGERLDGVSAVEAVQQMQARDVFIKGANALNYERNQAGILIGEPTGGTIGATIGTIVARRICLLMPVGLEKSTPGDLYEIYHRMSDIGKNGQGPILWPVPGEIFTEIEALHYLCGVKAELIGAGGILGAEGSVRISVWGRQDEVQRARGLIKGIYGEGPFG